jgi:hypothetical protein
MQFCVTRVILRDLAALVPQIFHSLHKITHFLTGYINSYFTPYSQVVRATYPFGVSTICSSANIIRLSSTFLLFLRLLSF